MTPPLRPISYKRYRFPPDVIRHAVWLYFRFTLSLRDVEELLAKRGVEVNYETIRCWTQKFGQQFARNPRRSRPRPTGRWHLDEMVVKIAGKRKYLWRAVDDEGEVLDMLVRERRNKGAALKLLRKLLKNLGVRPEAIVTDKLASYRAAARDLGLADRHRPGGMRENNRAENSHLPIRRPTLRTCVLKLTGGGRLRLPLPDRWSGAGALRPVEAYLTEPLSPPLWRLQRVEPPAFAPVHSVLGASARASGALRHGRIEIPDRSVGERADQFHILRMRPGQRSGRTGALAGRVAPRVQRANPVPDLFRKKQTVVCE